MEYLKYISIHAPLAGCDKILAIAGIEDEVFQSTHPLRGATIDNLAVTVVKLYFNPRTPCGVRLPSIYTLTTPAEFQSTHPLRGATKAQTAPRSQSQISIHAPLAGCDFTTEKSSVESNNISIHAPLAGCDNKACTWESSNSISIHAPLAGCDLLYPKAKQFSEDFNPRTPCGVRQQKRTKKCGTFAQIVQIQALCVQKMHIRRLDGRIFFKKYALFRCELFGKSVRAFGSHS